MMRARLPFVVVLGLCLAAVPAAAQEDAENSRDYKGLARMAGFQITDYEDLEFGMFEFEMPDGTQKRVEGHYYRIEYLLKEGSPNPGAIRIGRNYINAITAKGGTKIIDAVDNGGGHAGARFRAGNREIWVQADIHNYGETYTLHVIEEEAMQQDLELTAANLGKALAEKGSVAVRGILFDTGKATIKPESAAVLAQIAELLKTDAALALEIQGHTDNVGAAAANLTLSQQRAAAVKDYLVRTHAIAAARLTTAGFGDTKPVADNATDDGRAQNRRVELVKK